MTFEENIAPEAAPAPENKPEKAAPSTTPASEPRAHRERKQANFFAPDEPKSDGQKKSIPEVRLQALPAVPA
jgi:hypothetical protein